jgi:Gpi18-like mannosyltransferase
MPGPPIFAIKLVFVVFDVVLAFYVYRLVALRHTNWQVPALAAAIAVLLPTVVSSTSWYGQCDAIYASFALGATYYLLRNKPWLACAFAGISVAIKPQGIFILPVFVLVAVSGRLLWRHLIAIPGVYLLLDIPALLVGRDPVKLLTIYLSQANQTPGLANSGPSLWQWIPVGGSAHELRGLAYALTATVTLIACYAVVATRSRLGDTDVIVGATFLAMSTPFFMPGMHERYFFLADLLSLVLAFYLPKLWYVPILVQLASFLSYLPFMYGNWDKPLISAPEALPGMVSYQILSLLMAAATVSAAFTFFTRLGVWPPRATRSNTSDGSRAGVVGEPTEISVEPSDGAVPMGQPAAWRRDQLPDKATSVLSR